MSRIAVWRSAVGEAEASTRSLALVRIGLALVVFARMADEVALHRARGPAWALLGVALLLAAAALLAGWWSRTAAAVTAGSLAGVVFHLGVGQGHHELLHHHVSLLLIGVALLAFAPCGASLSVDRWLAVRVAEREGRPPPPEVGPRWVLWLLALQVSAVYFWGALDKTHAGWWTGARLEHLLLVFYLGSDPPDFPGYSALLVAAGTGTVLLEYVLAFGLWVPRWRRVLIPVAFGFHAVLYWVVPVQTFTVTMYVLLLAFLPPERVHAATERLLGRGSPA